MHRRAFLRSAVFASLAAPGCNLLDVTPEYLDSSPRLKARAGTGPFQGASIGLQQSLGLSAGRDGILWVPTGYTPATPAPLLVLLHGATGLSTNWFGSYGTRANARGLIIVAPDSRAFTWDAIHGDFGADVAFIDAALTATFQKVAVDPNRIAIGGFSDGASYALALGTANGDLFSRIVAYSPGFVPAAERVGKPKLFVSHGLSDTVLPINGASRVIVPRFLADGYDVTYREFEGGHEVPAVISDQALDWLFL
jgi:phospholipase/carboxylesterase